MTTSGVFLRQAVIGIFFCSLIGAYGGNKTVANLKY
jgi:hypothetical protein